MTREAFDHLVSSLETRYRGNHPALARRAMMFAMIGYLGLAILLLFGLALTVAMFVMIVLYPSAFTIKVGLCFGFGAAILTWTVAKALWVKLHPPEGMALRAEEAPELFRIIEETSRKAGGITFDQVLLTDDLNAAVVQVPRLGIFGWYRTYLILGLPLMDALSPEEFQSVIAHEFAHLSHQHGRLGTWLYRLRASWSRVIDGLSGTGTPAPVRAFVLWFWPQFNASAFVLSRSQEYQADAFGATVTSPDIAGRALQRIVVESRRLDEGFWDELAKESAVVAVAPVDVYQRMHAFFDTEPDGPRVTRWLARALAMQTGTADTHPGLKDRLAALGVTAAADGALPPLSMRASTKWLAPELAHRAREKFSQEWHRQSSAKWEEMHRRKQELRQRLEKETEPANEDEEWERLSARAALESAERVQPALVEFLARHPEHLEANFRRGQHLAEEDDLAAIPFLEKVVLDSSATLAALGEMAGLYDRLGMPGEVAEMKRRADQHDRRMAIESVARSVATSVVSKKDSFHPAELTESERASLLAALGRQKYVRNAWLVMKETPANPEMRHQVLAVELRWPMFHFKAEGADHRLLQEILNNYETKARVVAISKASGNRAVFKKIAAVTGSQIKSKKTEALR